VYKLILFAGVSASLLANPVGEKVVMGEVVVERPSHQEMNVVQMSPNAVIEWDQFSIGAAESTRFIQPDETSAVLNRVVGGDLTEIYGKMEGNGQIYLVNPYGVLVGESGVIDCASFLASSLDVKNQPFFEEQNLVFEEGAKEGSIVNKGSIRAFGGPLYLVGASVENTGQLKARDDSVYMVRGNSGERPRIMIRPSETVQRGALQSPYRLAVNCEGVEEGSVVRKIGERIFLESPLVPGADSGFVNGPLYVEDTLDALQQIRTLIPERLWYQEFAWLIDTQKFQSVATELANYRRGFSGTQSAISIGSSEYYFMHATFSGEAIRIMDRYLEFIDSPYWKNPDTLHYLYYLQNHYSKVSR